MHKPLLIATVLLTACVAEPPKGSTPKPEEPQVYTREDGSFYIAQEEGVDMAVIDAKVQAHCGKAPAKLTANIAHFSEAILIMHDGRC